MSSDTACDLSLYSFLSLLFYPYLFRPLILVHLCFFGGTFLYVDLADIISLSLKTAIGVA